LSSVFIQRFLCPQSLSSAIFVISLYPALSLSSVFIQRYPFPQSLSSAILFLILYPALSLSSVFINPYLIAVLSLLQGILAVAFLAIRIHRYPPIFYFFIFRVIHFAAPFFMV
jgi:hypothetical protein